MKKYGNNCTMILCPNGKHGWFNSGKADGSPFHGTTMEMERFLKKLSYFNGEQIADSVVYLLDRIPRNRTTNRIFTSCTQ